MAKKALPEFLRVPWTVPQALGVFFVPWIVIPIVVTLVILLLQPIYGPARDLTDALQSGDVATSFVFDLVTVVAAAGMVALYLRKYDVGLATVGWRRTSIWRTLGYFALGVVGFFVLAGALIALVSLLDPRFNANQPQTDDFTSSVPTHRSLTLIALVLIPPIIEETVFRGFIFPAIAKKWGTVGGAIASSALFGLAHLQANVSIYTFALGLVLCFLYVKLKSIFPGMAIHMLNNLLAYYVLASK